MDKLAILTRTCKADHCDGVMVLDDLQQIKTLELPDLDNQHGISCIPLGDYTCTWSHMDAHNVDHYEVNDVPGRTGIFLHFINMQIPNPQQQLLGCIGMAHADIDRLESWGNKDNFTLRILEVTP